jgi:hypothetical protein
VPIGVRADGRKELVALTDGYREATESWADLLLDCRRRTMRAPVLEIRDGHNTTRLLVYLEPIAQFVRLAAEVTAHNTSGWRMSLCAPLVVDWSALITALESSA